MGIVNNLCPKRHHQRRSGSLTVALVAFSKVLSYAVGRASPRSFFQAGIEEIFELGLWKDIRAYVASFHYEIPKLHAFPLSLLHPLAYLRNRRDKWNGSANLSSPDFLLRIVPVYLQDDTILDALQSRLPFSAYSSNGFRIINRNALAQAIPGQCPVHRAGVHVNKIEIFRYEPRVCALAAGTRAINRYDNWISLSHRSEEHTSELQ